MALQVAPLLSPTEFSLTFPVSNDLWSASCAEEWRALYLQKNFDASERGLTISQGINGVSQLRCQQNIDLTFAATVIIHSTWCMVYSNSLLQSLTRSQPTGQHHWGFSLDSYHNSGIVRLIEQVVLSISDCEGCLRPQLALVSERTLMDLHVSFEHLRLFAGKEGEEEARQAYPVLQRWAESSDARKAIWHAGQILKAARRCSAESLREFGSICVYHAALTFWAYGFLLTAVPDKAQSHSDLSQPLSNAGEMVWLDGDDVPNVQRFISLNRGIPVIHDKSGQPNGSVSPRNSKALMELCIALLRKAGGGIGNDSDSPLVKNLNQLMRDLENAARACYAPNR